MTPQARHFAFLIGTLFSAIATAGTHQKPFQSPKTRWIGTGAVCWDWRSPVRAAPTFRGTFELEKARANLRIAVCGLGYFECRLDGRPVTDAMLMPGETQYDVRWRYRVFNLPELAKGRHVVTITCGDGLYRATTPDVWHFDKATWAAYPKAVCEISSGDGEVVLRTDDSWQWRPSPTIFTSLRGGETYDARKAFADDSNEGWIPVAIVAPPGGIGEEEKFPPCRVVRVHAMTNRTGTAVWEAPVTLAGNVRIRARGERGAKVTIVTAERISEDAGHVDLRGLDIFDLGKPEKTFQRDTFMLAGEGEETWSPRFTYHGFKYAELRTAGIVEILSVEALEINNDFPRIGRVTEAPPAALHVANACERSILGNFHNIPTDCPTREKNGWTSEARIMCEAALYSFDAGSAYAAYADLIGDTQRPSGQISAIAPCNGWGYNWGSGPAWDTALMEIPDAVYRFTGDRSSIERLYPKIARYLDFAERMLGADGLPAHGLGDWDGAKDEYPRLARAGFRIRNLAYGERFARLLGKQEDALRFSRLRTDAVAAFRRAFCGPDGLSAATNSFPHALMLDFGIVEKDKRAECAKRLAETVERNGARIDYGTLGSRCVLRMLFEHGHADLAWRMMTQPDYPGYAFLTETLGMTTFPERWNIHIRPEVHGNSRNHGAFTDYLAVAYRHLGGIRHPTDRPGRDFIEVRPSFPPSLPAFACEHEGYKVGWKRDSGNVRINLTVPKGKSARYVFADGHAREFGEGTWTFSETTRQR